MQDPNQQSGTGGTIAAGTWNGIDAWRSRYKGSFAEDVVKGLGAVDFADRILVFGASLLLAVLPLIIVVSGYAGHNVAEDIATHLGLSAEGDQIIASLFKASNTGFNLAILVGLILSLAGTLGVARSVEAIYERAFGCPPISRVQAWLRSLVWVGFVTALVIGDAAIGKTLRDGPGGPLVFGVVEFVGFTVFFWWSMHFLLSGRVPWQRLLAAAISTALLWMGLGVFAAFYFSSSIVTDSKTYGTIGVTFTLVSWFIAMGAVLTLGAVVGAVWQKRWTRIGRRRHTSPEQA